jgi:hypothetical protein
MQISPLHGKESGFRRHRQQHWQHPSVNLSFVGRSLSFVNLSGILDGTYRLQDLRQPGRRQSEQRTR